MGVQALASKERMGEALPMDLPPDGFHPINEGAGLRLPICSHHRRADAAWSCMQPTSSANNSCHSASIVSAEQACTSSTAQTLLLTRDPCAGVDFAKAYRLGMRGPFQRFTALTWKDRQASAWRSWLLHHVNSLGRLFSRRAGYFRTCLVC